jgi:negative regulator of sigma E activity
MKKQKLEHLLYKSFDSELSEKEKESLDSELKSSETLKEEQKYLSKLRIAIKQSAQTSFEPFFEERLMGNLNRTANKEKYFDLVSSSLFSSFGRIAIAAIVVLAILLSYNLHNGNNYSINSLFGSSKANIASVFDPFENTIGAEKK